ncbi:MAG: putative Ig domain-containing protein [Acidobacteriaceae bacterium]|nr:putative Ig domain-containing protein [Acidobacteriaceae bacterium]
MRALRPALQILLILHAVTAACFAQAPVINEYPTPTQPSSPAGITAGPDGALWFAEQTANSAAADPNQFQIGRIATGGAVTEFLIPPVTIAGSPGYPEPQGIAAGPDGALWFTGLNTSTIGRITTSGAITQYFIPSGGNPQWIVQGPDGALWFTEQAFGSAPAAIGRIDTSGAFTEYTIPTPGSSPIQIAAGPDGALWYADEGANQIGRISTSGVFTTYDLPTSGANPFGITAGPDGALWFTEGAANEIGRITTSGGVTEYPIPTSSAGPEAITLGPDGALWFTENSPIPGQIGRITTSGNVVEYMTPTPFSGPLGITTGPDGALWFTENDGNNIGQLIPVLTLTCSLPPGQVGAAYSGSCMAVSGKTPYTYSISAGALPAGLALNASTGAVTGVPTAGGTFAFTVQVTDSSSPPQTATQQITAFTVAVRTPLLLACSISSSPQVNVPFSASCTASGGVPPSTYAISAGALPPGLSLNAATGAVTGTPTHYGPYSFTVQAKDSGIPPFTATQSISVNVLPAKLTISCNLSSLAEVGIAYSEGCIAAGGIPPYTFSTGSTFLPGGLSQDPTTGAITGVPTTPGTSSFIVQVMDSGPPVQTATYAVPNFSVIAPPLAIACDFSNFGKVGVPYSTSCVASNGASPYTYSIGAGALPAGLVLNASTGTVTGAPTASGRFSFTLKVVDSQSPAATAIQNVNGFLVQPAVLTLATSIFPNGAVGLPYSGDPLAAGGTSPYTWSVSAGSLPAGLMLSAITGAVTGTPTASGAFSFTLSVKDSSSTPETATQAYTGTIAGPVAPEFAEYALPTASGADGIVPGPDGALWFTTADQPLGNQIGRITTAGVITNVYPSPNALNSMPQGQSITVGPDANLWFAEADAARIGQITTGGATIDFPVATSACEPASMATGLDGSLWFTEESASKIGRLTTAGVITEYLTPTASSGPRAIVAGPDGALWFTENAANKIGRITTAGAITEYRITSAASGPAGITVGPDGALWFTENAASKIGRISIGGVVTEYATPTAATGPETIAAGNDGALWFTETSANQIGRITTAGVMTEYAIPTPASGPQGITLGPDNALWFAENSASKIGRITFVPQIMLTCSFPAGASQVGTAYSATCTASAGTAPYTFSIGAGTLPTGLTFNPSTGAITGTPTAPGTFTFTAKVADSSDPAQTATQTATITVLPRPLMLACSLPGSGQLGAVYTGMCQASFGMPPYTYSVSTGALPLGLTLSSSTGAVAGTPTTPGTFSFTVSATDSSSPRQIAAQSITLVIKLGTVTGTGTPLFTLSGLPSSQTPGENLTNASLVLNQAASSAINGTVTLSFTPYAGDSGLPSSSYADPALQFVNGNGHGLGTTYNFTIPASATVLALPEIDPGTVAGEITLTVTVDDLTETTSNVTVQPSAPIIESGSVQIMNLTSSGFDVELVANSSTRDLTYATFTFTPASGATILGDTAFTFDVSSLLSSWFASSSGLSYGGAFSLTVPFQLSGPASAIQSVSVTLTNSVGASTAVTGTQ